MITKNLTHDLKLKMRSGKPVFTAMLGPGNEPPGTVQRMKEAGFDFLILDREHSLISEETVNEYIIVGKESGVPIFLRPEEVNASWRRFLDSGISGLYLGMVNTVEQAACAVGQSYFPPIGHRGSSLGMNPYLIDGQSLQEVPYLSLLQYVNDNTAILACTESLESITNLPNILRVEGITGVVAASQDLMLDIATVVGDAKPEALIAERLTADYITKRLRQILSIAREAGKVAGIGGLPSSEVYARWCKEGFRILMLGSARDGNIEKLCRRIEEIRESVK